MPSELKTLFNVLAVTGAWVAGMAVLATVLAFCFAMIQPRLFRIGIAMLLLFDVGLVVMMGSLAFLIQDNVLWGFDIVGLVVLLALTGFVVTVVQRVLANDKATAGVIETTRRRIEF